MQVQVVIAAAGSASRMGKQPANKPYLIVKGEPVLVHSLRFFENLKQVDMIVIVASTNEVEFCRQEIVKKYGFKKVVSVVEGGISRQDSVFRGIKALKIFRNDENVLLAIHDAARPFPNAELFENLCNAAKKFGGAVPGLKVTNTVKEIDKNGFVLKTLPRDDLRSIQTPQIFRFSEIFNAYEKAEIEEFSGTDDAMIYEHYYGCVKVITTDHDNLKITTPADLNRLQKEIMPMENNKNMIFIGTGFDVHRLVENRKLIIGGVEINHEKGLLGHSDADVLVHAICDSLLGAAALGDIGQHFPDADPQYIGIESLKLLSAVKDLLKEHGCRIINIDSTIIAERPKMKPYISQMRFNIAKTIEIDMDFVSVKATTSEKLGFTGREEGIAAEAVCLIEKSFN